MNKEEINLLNYQQIGTVLFITSLFISLFLTYNDMLELTNNNKILSNKNYYNLSVFNRVFVVAISLIFLYTNYRNREISKREGKNLNANNLQVAASELNIIAAIIVLYVVITSGDYSVVTTTGNPNL